MLQRLAATGPDRRSEPGLRRLRHHLDARGHHAHRERGMVQRCRPRLVRADDDEEPAAPGREERAQCLHGRLRVWLGRRPARILDLPERLQLEPQGRRRRDALLERPRRQH